ncbi:hypothetical protein SeSPB_A3612 [Salmonella enterica subsp. enterica serovar Saintpaul str. SARA29]|nr:hypothetical protein SeSPB_A3612 [Salmonella enterica subsp. enterica serovar Saintpaul str. SARA29]
MLTPSFSLSTRSSKKKNGAALLAVKNNSCQRGRPATLFSTQLP